MRNRLVALVLVLLLSVTCFPACSEGEEGGSRAARAGAGALKISRPQPGGVARDVEPGSWTVFVYLCASDLESDEGAATADLAEMVAASGNENLNVVVQTGGAKSWDYEEVNAKKCQRFLIQDTAIYEVDRFKAQNMGLASTLEDFLTWGVATYPAEHMGVILWNHGGGSIAGVCMDERFDDDTLVLRELDEAFDSTFATMSDKFEFVGCDACLMGTIETAHVLASYANYMIASEEWEPGTGWSYTGFLEYLAKHPSANGAELGKVICDEYLSSIESEEDVSTATLSVIDLSRIDRLLSRFDTFSDELVDATSDDAELATAVRGIGEADNFGGNNRSEGYTNMVDLGGLVSACADAAPSGKKVLSALNKAVVYHGEGSSHEGASGLSVYYPLHIEDSEELDTFEKVCVSPNYLSFVERIADGAGDLEDEGYSEGKSERITFASEPQLDDDGYFWFQLDEEGLDNTSSVSACVYQCLDDVQLDLGETYDVDADWETGTVYDNFDGYWLSLPDGQNLEIYPADSGDDYSIYTSPILLNDKETNLRIRLYDDGTCVVEGTWDGILDSGISSKGVRQIEKGDVIVPCYTAYDDNAEPIAYEGEAFKVKGKKLKVSCGLLSEGEYLYRFAIDDLYGDYLLTDDVVFAVDEEGTVSFEG